MRAILDTSILLADHPDAPDLAGIEGMLSSVSYGELNFGVAVARTDRERTARLARVQRIVAIFGAGVAYDDVVASSFGHLYGISHRAGHTSRTRVADLMIAATAHSLGVPLVTRNPADFTPLVTELTVLQR